eukprot:9493699-Pyramimonas_sp.AAC.1
MASSSEEEEDVRLRRRRRDCDYDDDEEAKMWTTATTAKTTTTATTTTTTTTTTTSHDEDEDDDGKRGRRGEEEEEEEEDGGILSVFLLDRLGHLQDVPEIPGCVVGLDVAEDPVQEELLLAVVVAVRVHRVAAVAVVDDNAGLAGALHAVVAVGHHGHGDVEIGPAQALHGVAVGVGAGGGVWRGGAGSSSTAAAGPAPEQHFIIPHLRGRSLLPLLRSRLCLHNDWGPDHAENPHGVQVNWVVVDQSNAHQLSP